MSIEDIQTKITPVLRAYGIKRADIFGSVARGDDTEQSDLDLLIELGTPMGLIAYSRLARELEELLGRPVDLMTPASVNPHLRSYVERDLITVYEG